MEKKKCREKKRRQDVNSRFSELAELLDEIKPLREGEKKHSNRADLIKRAIDVLRAQRKEVRQCL